jgi:hypothetical protein
MSVKTSAQRLDVSAASASVWVRDIELTSEQRAALLRREQTGAHIGRAVAAEHRRAERRQWQESGRNRVCNADPMYAAGCMLYWAEGGKARNSVRFTNSDPDMVAFFVDFLRTSFDVPDERMRVWLNLFADHVAVQHDIEEFWLAILSLPRTCLTRSTVNVYSKYTKKKRLNRLAYGTCRVTVSDTRIVQTIYGSIQALGGAPRDAWLD